MTRQSYSPDIRIVRLMCTGRVDLAFVVRAFLKGADGVIIGGCWPGECHYVTEGNYDALGNMYLAKKLLAHVGLSPDRLRLEWIAASEGARFAEVMNDFSEQIRALGPLGRQEGLDAETVQLELRAIESLVPYLKLVEREKLRIPIKSEDAYRAFWEGEAAQRIFDEMIARKLTVSRIMTLLSESPQTTVRLAEVLGLEPAEISKVMNESSRQGLVAYDVDSNRYALV